MNVFIRKKIATSNDIYSFCDQFYMILLMFIITQYDIRSNKQTIVPSKDSDQSVYPQWSSVNFSTSLDPDQDRHSVGSDLGPNCLLRLSVDDKSRR